MGKQDGVRPERRENSGVFFHRRAVMHESPSAATCLRLAVLLVRGEHGSTHTLRFPARCDSAGIPVMLSRVCTE